MEQSQSSEYLQKVKQNIGNKLNSEDNKIQFEFNEELKE